MANQPGAAALPVQRRVEATMISFSEEAAPAGKFAARVRCDATRSFEFWRRGHEHALDAVLQRHAAGSNAAVFAVDDLAEFQTAAACRDTLRGMLAVLPQLRSLGLAADEWDAVVPEDVVPEIVGAAGRGNGFTFCFRMKVHLQVTHDERALLLVCKEWLASPAPGEKEKEKDCPICVDGLEREYAVELPGCNHAFHFRCISMWFSTAETCPNCRADVWQSALPKFIELASSSGPADLE